MKLKNKQKKKYLIKKVTEIIESIDKKDFANFDIEDINTIIDLYRFDSIIKIYKNVYCNGQKKKTILHKSDKPIDI